jgi:uncharacterized protein
MARLALLRSGSRLALSPAACALAIMAKAPAMGAVKTRLVPPLTPDEAAGLSSAFIRDAADNIAALGDPAVHGYVAYAPLGAEAAFEPLLPTGFRLLAQRGGDLGERLDHAAMDLLGAGYAGMCLINSDSPTLPTAILRRAVDLLRRPGERVVLGGAEDGGYYLIGLKALHPRLFADIDWSTERVFGQTLARAAEIGLAVERLPIWRDVDDAAALAALHRELFAPAARSDALEPFPAPATRRFLGGRDPGRWLRTGG